MLLKKTVFLQARHLVQPHRQTVLSVSTNFPVCGTNKGNSDSDDITPTEPNGLWLNYSLNCDLIWCDKLHILDTFSYWKEWDRILACFGLRFCFWWICSLQHDWNVLKALSEIQKHYRSADTDAGRLTTKSELQWNLKPVQMTQKGMSKNAGNNKLGNSENPENSKIKTENKP